MPVDWKLVFGIARKRLSDCFESRINPAEVHTCDKDAQNATIGMFFDTANSTTDQLLKCIKKNEHNSLGD